MSPEQTETIIKYLVQKLPPDDQQELSTMLGEDLPDFAEDAMKRGIAFDKLPAAMQRRFIARGAAKRSEGDRKGFEERYPNANRLR